MHEPSTDNAPQVVTLTPSTEVKVTPSLIELKDRLNSHEFPQIYIHDTPALPDNLPNPTFKDENINKYISTLRAFLVLPEIEYRDQTGLPLDLPPAKLRQTIHALEADLLQKCHPQERDLVKALLEYNCLNKNSITRATTALQMLSITYPHLKKTAHAALEKSQNYQNLNLDAKKAAVQACQNAAITGIELLAQQTV